MNDNSLLEKLGEKYEPSKRLHNYLPIYALYFEGMRKNVKSFLEIGLETDRSINMWEEYFPNAQIYGLDIEESNLKFTGGRKEVFIGDQGNQKILDALPGNFDIIIDDGSHKSEDILFTFKYLFPRLNSKGYYAIEDLELDLSMNKKATSFFKELVDHVNYWPSNFLPSDWPKLNDFNESSSWWDKNVLSISFYRYLTFVQKGKNPQEGEAQFRIKNGI